VCLIPDTYVPQAGEQHVLPSGLQLLTRLPSVTSWLACADCTTGVAALLDELRTSPLTLRRNEIGVDDNEGLSNDSNDNSLLSLSRRVLWLQGRRTFRPGLPRFVRLTPVRLTVTVREGLVASSAEDLGIRLGLTNGRLGLTGWSSGMSNEPIDSGVAEVTGASTVIAWFVSLSGRLSLIIVFR